MRKRKTTSSKLTNVGRTDIGLSEPVREVKDFQKMVVVDKEMLLKANEDLKQLLRKTSPGRLLEEIALLR